MQSLKKNNSYTNKSNSNRTSSLNFKNKLQIVIFNYKLSQIRYWIVRLQSSIINNYVMKLVPMINYSKILILHK